MTTSPTSGLAGRVPEPEPAPTPPGALPRRRVLAILLGLMLGMLLSGLDQTIVASASRTIGDALGGLDEQAWLTTAFLITSTVTTLLYGKLSDLYGRKPLYLVAVGLFLLGSALCGLATSMASLTAFRALQGLGAGGLMSLAFAITADVVPPRERASYQGYFAATMALSSLLGPLAGGFFASQPELAGVAGWRWAFWVNLPIGLAAMAVVARTLPRRTPARAARVDWAGAVLLCVALVPLLLVGQEGMTWGWASTPALTCYLVGGAGVLGFVLRQLRAGDDGLLPLGLLRRRAFAVPVLLTFVVGAAQFGGIVLLPLYLQIVRGASPTVAGALLVPMVLGISVTSVVVGRLVRRTGRTTVFPVLGMLALTVAFLGLSTVSSTTPLAVVDVLMLVIGVGLGATTNTVMLLLQTSVGFGQLGVASAAGTFFRNIGATTGTAVLLTLLFGRAARTIPASYAAAAQTPGFSAAAAAHPEQVATVHDAAANGLADTSFLGGLDPRLAEPFLAGFTRAMDQVALVAAAVGAVGLVLALLLERRALPAAPGAGRPVASRPTAGAVPSSGA